MTELHKPKSNLLLLIRSLKAKMVRCQSCGKAFTRKDNMLRHMKTAHESFDSDTEDMELSEPETDVSDESEITGADSEGEGTEADSEGEETEEDSEGEEKELTDPWKRLIDLSFEKCQSLYKHNVNDYKKEHRVDIDVAKQKVYRDMRSVYRKQMVEAFLNMIEWLRDLQKDRTFIAIRNTARDLRSLDDYGEEESWKYAVKKRKFLFDKILSKYYPPEMSDVDSAASDAVAVDGQIGGGKIEIIGKRSGLLPFLNQGGITRVQQVERWVEHELSKH